MEYGLLYNNYLSVVASGLLAPTGALIDFNGVPVVTTEGTFVFPT